MILEASVRLAQALRLDDITDIEPDAGILGAEAEQNARELLAAVLWIAQAVMFAGLIAAIAYFGITRRNNPQKADAARSWLVTAIVAQVLYGGIATIIAISRGLIG